MSSDIDQDAIVACADLVGRTGATNFEVGYLHDGVPIEKAGWYATAQYRGAKLIAGDKSAPDEACDGLARRILSGAQCTHCKKRITLDSTAAAFMCRWRRMGDKWVMGCEDAKVRKPSSP